MKKIFIFLMIVCILVPIITYGTAIVTGIQFNARCISFFAMAADANSVALAEKHLTSGLEYLEKHNLTDGSTHIVVYNPRNDLGLWYENLKSAQSQLQELISKDDLTDLEESNALMKLRETLLTSEGAVTRPSMVAFYPAHIAWSCALWLVWIFWICAYICWIGADDCY